MIRYCKNDKPYIYAAFAPSQTERAHDVMEALNSDGVQFWYANRFDSREKRRIKGAFGVLLFVTTEFASSERFHMVVDTAVKCGHRILCVYVDQIDPTPWSELQLGTQQAVFDHGDTDDLIEKLRQALIFGNMVVTKAQKKFQRNRAVIAVTAPIVAAAVIFLTVVNPLLIAPTMSTANIAQQWGLTLEDLKKVTALHIVGDQVFDASVHAWYESDDRTMVAYDLNVDGSMEHQPSISTGKLTSDDLNIIRYMPNLEILELEGNQITDISPIFETDIRSLWLNCNPISSLEGIQKMSSLTSLSIVGTNITDLSPILELPNLQHLQFDNTYISDLTGIESIETLDALMMSNTQVTELPKFGKWENFTLDLRGLRIYDLSPIADVASFNELYIDSMDDCMRPQDLVPYLSGKPISFVGWCGVERIEDLFGLNIVSEGSLCLANNFLTTLDGIENFEGIKTLGLFHHEGDPITFDDLTPILRLKSLELLELSPDMREMAEKQLQDAHFVIDYKWG